MKAAEILELESLTFAERSFADLADPDSALPAFYRRPDDGRLLVDEKEDLLAVAFRWDERWIVANYLYHPVHEEAIDLFEGTGGDLFMKEREVWARAVREYYSGRSERVCAPLSRKSRMTALACAADVVT